MVIDKEGCRWYWDTAEEMLESVRLGNVEPVEYYVLEDSKILTRLVRYSRINNESN